MQPGASGARRNAICLPPRPGFVERRTLTRTAVLVTVTRCCGWRPSYPEPSSYIATTCFRLARERDPSYAERARRILRWLLSVQNADGPFSNPRHGKRGIVFDAGQVLFGLVKGFEPTGSRELLVGARRAAAWLTQF